MVVEIELDGEECLGDDAAWLSTFCVAGRVAFVLMAPLVTQGWTGIERTDKQQPPTNSLIPPCMHGIIKDNMTGC